MALIWIADPINYPTTGGYWFDTFAPPGIGAWRPFPIGPPIIVPPGGPSIPPPPPAPIAQFLYIVGSGRAVRFTNRSLQATQFMWFFGDGLVSRSISPIHIFPAVGAYAVILRAYNSVGSYSDFSATIAVTDIAPAADFSIIQAGVKTFFYDASTVFGTSWLWSFGDGGTSTLQNPTHEYGADGTYNVTLTVSGFTTTKSVTVTSNTSPTFSHTWSTTALATAIAADENYVYVAVADEVVPGNPLYGTTNATIQIWDKAIPPTMVDSITVGGTQINGIDVYGAYLYVGNSRINIATHAVVNMGMGTGDDIKVSGGYIYTGDARYLLNSFVQDGGYAFTEGIQFAISAGFIYACLYSILIESESSGSTVDTIPADAHFSDPRGVAVTNGSIYIAEHGVPNTVVRYNLETKEYIETVNGTFEIGASYPYTYPIGLLVNDGLLYVANRTTRSIQAFTLSSAYFGDGIVPFADFSMSTNNGTVPLSVVFTNLTTGDMGSMTYLWEFGDGNTSTSESPSHTWTAPGLYTIRLTATNDLGTSSHMDMVMVISTDTPPIFDPIGQIGSYVVDTENNAVNIIGTDGTLLSTFGGAGTTAGKFFMPTTCSVINGRQRLDRVEISEE